MEKRRKKMKWRKWCWKLAGSSDILQERYLQAFLEMPGSQSWAKLCSFACQRELSEKNSWKTSRQTRENEISSQTSRPKSTGNSRDAATAPRATPRSLQDQQNSVGAEQNSSLIKASSRVAVRCVPFSISFVYACFNVCLIVSFNLDSIFDHLSTKRVPTFGLLIWKMFVYFLLIAFKVWIELGLQLCVRHF